MTRKLDALVAEKAMEESAPICVPFDPLAFLHDVKSEDGNWYLTSDYGTGDVPYWHPLHFSTDIAAAWRVVDKMFEQPCQRIYLEFRRYLRDLGGLGRSHFMPKRISLAALCAIGVPEEVIQEALQDG